MYVPFACPFYFNKVFKYWEIKVSGLSKMTLILVPQDYFMYVEFANRKTT